MMTGVLESIERDDCKSLIERYGGKVTTSISRNTKYLIVGRDSGISKIAKVIEIVNIVIISSTPLVEIDVDNKNLLVNIVNIFLISRQMS